MKILQVNCVYKNGSTGKIVSDIHSELLQHGIESVVCYGRGNKVDEKFVYKTCGELYSYINHFISNLTGIMYGGCRLSTNKLISIIKKENPDIVHLHCINGYFVNIYRLVEWLKNNHIRTVVTLHAEFMYTGGCGYSIDCDQWSNHMGCGYSQKCPRWHTATKSWFFDRTGTMWRRMKKAFYQFDSGIVIASVSPWLMERAQKAPILEGKKHCVVLNGLDTEIFHLRNSDSLRKKHSITNEKIIFHVTPSFNLNPQNIKGGFYVNELAKRLLNENIKIIVAGPYMDRIQVSENIILLGRITDQDLLAQYYSMADITILTSVKETFSMVTAESLCCGTRVVGFKAGGPEQIALREYSSFVDYGDLYALEQTVKEILSLEKIDKKSVSKYAIAKYGKEAMCNSYIKIYKALYNE